jgi:four helix bundle protein
MSFKFEQLRVWQSALDISLEIHNLTRGFPKEEIFILTSQIKRAADSISLNIAEGSTGQSNPEQNRFLGYALRSAIEVITCLHIGRKRQLIKEEDFQRIYQNIESLIISIQAFRKTIKIK